MMDSARKEIVYIDPTPNVLRLVESAVELFRSEIKRIDERWDIYDNHLKERALAEAKRLDAVREVDATAVRVANDRAIEQASALADQVSTSAEVQRALVAATAAAVAANLQQAAKQLADRLDEQ